MTSGALRTTEPVAAFAAIARALTESLELAEVLRRIADEALALTDATGVSIILRRGEFAEFVAHASPPPGSLIPVGFRFRPSQAIVQEFRGRTEPLVIKDLHSSPLIPDVVKERIFVNDIVIVPLRTDDQLIGVLNLAFNQMPDPVPWDPVILGALADQAALAVRNAQLYEATRSATEQLLQTEKLSALGRLVAQVTHELNNPLTTARLLTESLDIEPLPYAATDLVRSLSSELEHAANIVRDLLLFVHRPTAREEIDVVELVHGLVADLERRTSAAGITIDLDVDEPVPTLRADPHAMRQVIQNLVQNGIQALAGLETERRIRIGVRGENGERGQVLVVEVEDTGPGISGEVHNRLFEPFFTTKPMGEGTGLGLAIIKGIVETYDGTIEGLNAPGGGALFRIRLPAFAPTGETPALAGPATAAVPGANDVSPAPRSGLRVLIIDDEPELQRALQRVLMHLGCEVTTALDGESGLQAAREEPFDLILCDVRLPGLHGQELLDRLRQEAPAAAEVITFMTGDTITREIRDFIASTGRPSLTKPFGRAQLEVLLRSAGAPTADQPNRNH